MSATMGKRADAETLLEQATALLAKAKFEGHSPELIAELEAAHKSLDAACEEHSDADWAAHQAADKVKSEAVALRGLIQAKFHA